MQRRALGQSRPKSAGALPPPGQAGQAGRRGGRRGGRQGELRDDGGGGGVLPD